MKQQLESLIQKALAEISPNTAPIPITLERPRDPSHGDWSSSIAMVAAKSLKQPPRAIAEQLIALMQTDDNIEAIELAGPGFINFKLSKGYLHQQLENIWTSPSCGVVPANYPETVIIDYSSPNLAKEMHVGHLRSTIIGDALARILSFQGQTVIRQNHIGDWGTQFGMLMAHMHALETDTKQTFDLSDLESFYQAAKKRFDEDSNFADEARAWVVKLQAHEPVSQALWTRFIRLSLAHCQSLYQRLGVSLTEKDNRAESAYNDMLPKVVDSLQTQGLLTDQDGTKCVFLEQFKGKDQQPLPIIVQKKDGGYLYATSDLAALDYRDKILHADRILYVVDARQSLHFQQVFALALAAGFVSPQICLEHIEFGMILDKAGKPFKSREGRVTKLVDLIDEAEHRAAALIASKNPHLSEQDCQNMATVIGIGAVKYADLSKNRGSDYIFDWDTMLSFEGNTAPYLLYANTRIHSIFQKAGITPESLSRPLQIETAQEIALGKHLALFPDTIALVGAKATPHLLCTYLYELAGLFSSFYEHCPILSAEAPQQQSRLKIAALTSKILEKGLDLLGIKTLKKM
ncbi:MAG: arginine--tRNA ligase [Gammaproteobacteria bacterium]|nr:arginine--tRNA ligase [Gammaproteobacteria bacterium]